MLNPSISCQTLLGTEFRAGSGSGEVPRSDGIGGGEGEEGGTYVLDFVLSFGGGKGVG